MNISISQMSEKPFYQQIEEQIITKIISGTLQPDEGLPSIRSLAKELTTSVITVKRAYQELEKAGWIYARPGLGTFIADVDRLKIKREILTEVEKHLQKALAEAEKAGIEDAQVLNLLEELIVGRRENNA